MFERWWLSAWPHRFSVFRRVPRFLKACPEPFRGEVLEVGAGSGWTTQRILETFPQVELTALDKDLRVTKCLASLQRIYGRRLEVVCADVLDLPFDRHVFDIIIAVNALHHFDDVRGSLQQLLRVLRPGGLLGVADDNPRSGTGLGRWPMTYANKIDRVVLEQLLSQETCEILVAQGESHYTLWARKPYPVTPRTLHS